MTLATVLTTALGLTLTYTLLSLMASTVKEWLAGFLQLRGKQLEKALIDMLSGGGAAGADAAALQGLAASVYAHGMVSTVSPRTHQASKPSYVPARNFTLALLDVLTDGSQSAPASAVAQAIADLPGGRLKQSLQVLADAAGGDLDALKAGIDQWFDDTMDRITGFYRRNAQLILFLIGLALAVVLNIDTIRITSKLLRADNVVSENIEKIAKIVNAKYRDQVTAPAPGGGESSPAGGTPATPPDANNAQLIADITDQLGQLPIEIGWQFCQEADQPTVKPPDNAHPLPTCDKSIQLDGLVLAQGTSWLAFVRVLFGWLLTGAAISFGAPFWFDLLNNFINLRAAGPTPAPTNDTTASTS